MALTGREDPPLVVAVPAELRRVAGGNRLLAGGFGGGRMSPSWRAEPPSSRRGVAIATRACARGGEPAWRIRKTPLHTSRALAAARTQLVYARSPIRALSLDALGGNAPGANACAADARAADARAAGACAAGACAARGMFRPTQCLDYL